MQFVVKKAIKAKNSRKVTKKAQIYYKEEERAHVC